MSTKELVIAYTTQSQNTFAKMALCMEEYLKNHLDYDYKIGNVWNLLEDPILYTTSDAFLFLDNSFYFRMLKNIIDNLIPSGVMDYLIENHYAKKFEIQKLEEDPKVLSIDDLLFGFKIWFGSCLISFLAFFFEQLVRLKKRFDKSKTEALIDNSTEEHDDVHEDSNNVDTIVDIHENRDLEIISISDDELESHQFNKAEQLENYEQDFNLDLHLDILDLLKGINCKY